MKNIYLIIIIAVLLTGCSTVCQHRAQIPLEGSFISDRAKTMEWMAKNDPTGKLEDFPEKFEMMFGDLIHNWSSGRLTVVLNENESIHSKTKWVEQLKGTYFSTEGGYIIRLISEDEYYLDAYAPAGLFREYFKRNKH